MVEETIKSIKETEKQAEEPVSYTHLDVYKRQICMNTRMDSESEM